MTTTSVDEREAFEAWWNLPTYEWQRRIHLEPRELALEAWQARAASQPAQEPVARLLYWQGPAHSPVPHGGIAARTFAEYSKKDADKPDSYWKNGEPLYTAPPADTAQQDRIMELAKRLRHFAYANGKADATPYKRDALEQAAFAALEREVRKL